MQTKQAMSQRGRQTRLAEAAILQTRFKRPQQGGGKSTQTHDSYTNTDRYIEMQKTH